uniref:Uncharacterized protein n=1 Tax=Tanacetum cinerariifolium TaxID=118510 RepID=A0A699K1H2_TANCI|nr:hypothetical protein [Tanacetum cinerariifolium]
MEGNKSIQQSNEQQNLYKVLVEAYEADKTILDTYGESTILKRRREDDDQEGPSAGSDWGSKRRREGGEHASASTSSESATGSACRSTTGSQSKQLPASESAFAVEPVQTTCQMEEPSHPVFETGAKDQPIIQTTQHPEWFSQPRRPLTPDRDWNKSVPAAQGNAQLWISTLAKQTNARSSFNELLDTPIDFSNFIMNRLSIDTLTPKLLAGPTYELMRGSRNSLTELEYHLEEVYKATVGNKMYKAFPLPVPTNTDPNDTSRRKDDEQSGRTVTITTEDMQRKKNDVKAITTLLLSLPNEHQLRFNKYKTTKELWAAILKTFGGNEATKKRKKNLLKQQYRNFKEEGFETLEQTFNRLQVIVSQLQSMDVEVEKDDLNQKFLTSLAPEWMMHTIVWRNRNDLDTMNLDDLYNHLKVYKAEVQMKSNSNSQNMAFISSSKNSSGNEDGNIACVSTASTTFPTGSVNVATISQDTASAYIASQSNGSQIKFEDINQIDKDDIEEMDIK